jgi:hypothetical protein
VIIAELYCVSAVSMQMVTVALSVSVVHVLDAAEGQLFERPK